MSSPIQFYRSFLTRMREHGIRHALTSGMACVEYGIQQNTKDTDWIIHPDDLQKLLTMLRQCENGLTGTPWRISYRALFGAPFLEAHHRGGWTTHIAIHDAPDSPEHHLDFFGQPPRVSLDEVFKDATNGLASRNVIAQMKKTDRDKDWPTPVPFTEQHEILSRAVTRHRLPTEPLGDHADKQRLVERMKELEWYHANFDTPDDLSECPAELDGGVNRP